MENKLLEYLENHQPATPSNWREKAEWRRENRDWIRHSQEIALAMLNKMDELKMSQTALAKQLGCSQQYVSKLLWWRKPFFGDNQQNRESVKHHYHSALVWRANR